MFFVLPQSWITPAIAAAALAFGPVPDHVDVKYRHLDGLGKEKPPSTIIIDKRPSWDKEQAQCVLVHFYGHLAGRKHSERRNSIMNPIIRYKPCHRWLVRHDVE